jgi:hypothetical protein
MSRLSKTNPYPLIISFITLRRAVGVLSISLPAILILGNYLIGGCTSIQQSVSHYYYTVMHDVFVGIICAISLFLIAYNDHDKRDGKITTIAGILLLGVAFFPTTQNQDPNCTVFYLEENIYRVYVHYASAIFFFCCLAYISFFLFTKGDKQKSKRKILRNRIHKSCGIIQILSIFLIVPIRTIPYFEITFGHLNPVFWIEWIALTAFGVSWLIKGEVFFKDVVDKFSD